MQQSEVDDVKSITAPQLACFAASSTLFHYGCVILKIITIFIDIEHWYIFGGSFFTSILDTSI